KPSSRRRSRMDAYASIVASSLRVPGLPERATYSRSRWWTRMNSVQASSHAASVRACRRRDSSGVIGSGTSGPALDVCRPTWESKPLRARVRGKIRDLEGAVLLRKDCPFDVQRTEVTELRPRL